MKDSIKPRQKNQNPLKCEICEKDFKSNDVLRAHFNGVHNVIKEYHVIFAKK